MTEKDIGGMTLSLIVPTSENLRFMTETTASSIYDPSGALNEKGFFSEEIYGQTGSEERHSNFSFISLGTKIVHPLLFDRLRASSAIYEEIIACKVYAVWDDNKKDFSRSTEELGHTGMDFFLNNCGGIVDKEGPLSDTRDSLYKAIKKYGVLTIEYCLIIPAGMRDIETTSDGRPEYDEINELYMALLSSVSMIRSTGDQSSLSASRVRGRIQTRVHAIFDYLRNTIKGKKKLLLKGVSSRSVTAGSRNVISPVIDTPEILFSPENIGGSKTVIGLYQMAASTAPITIFKLREMFLDWCFFGDSLQVSLIDPDTLSRRPRDVSVKTLDKWTTRKGLNRVIDLFKKKETRHDYVEIEGGYVALIYSDDKGYRVFNDIAECGEWVDKSKVRPLTYAEMFYLCTEGVADILPAISSRYPACEHGSVVPVMLYLKSTTTSSMLHEYTFDGELGTKFVKSFPSYGKKFHETMSPPSRNIARHGADFDGDQMGLIIAFSDESIREIKELINSTQYHVSGSGDLFYSSSRDTINLLLSSITSPLFRKDK